MAENEVFGNLSEIFPGVTDSSVQKAMEEVTTMAERFAEKSRGENWRTHEGKCRPCKARCYS